MPKFKVGDRVRRGVEEGNIVKFRPYEYATIEMDDGCRFDAPADQLQAIPSVPPLDLTKPVQTRDGRKVRLLCTDGPGNHPVVGFIDGSLYAHSWTYDGYQYSRADNSDADLINTPATPRTFERWFNVYKENGSIVMHGSRFDADDEIPWDTRIARKRVVFTEGEWDE